MEEILDNIYARRDYIFDTPNRDRYPLATLIPTGSVMSMLSKKYFHDEKAAFDHMEKTVWADGVAECPHCGVVGRSKRMEGKTTRLGLWKCYACRKQFTVRVDGGGTRTRSVSVVRGCDAA